MPKIAVISCETTGFTSKDEITALGVVVCSVSEKDAVDDVVEWYGEREPTVEISEQALKQYGKTVKMLQGKQMNLAVLAHLLSDVDVIISHHAKLEARLLHKLVPDVYEKEWRCSYRQWPWPSMGGNGKLEAVLTYYRLPTSDIHHALNGAKALLSALEQVDGGRSCLKKLLSKPPFVPTQKERVAKLKHKTFQEEVDEFFAEADGKGRAQHTPTLAEKLKKAFRGLF